MRFRAHLPRNNPAQSPSPSNAEHAYNTLLTDLLANTAFILNMVNSVCHHCSLETHCRARNVLSQSAALLLRLYSIQLRLRYWPSKAPAARQHCLAAAERYIALCGELADFLERMQQQSPGANIRCSSAYLLL